MIEIILSQVVGLFFCSVPTWAVLFPPFNQFTAIRGCSLSCSSEPVEVNLFLHSVSLPLNIICLITISSVENYMNNMRRFVAPSSVGLILQHPANAVTG